MLASPRARFFAPVLVALVAALPVGAASCADSIHLDPPGGGTSTGSHTSSSGGHGGSGGNAPTACSSNPDCAYPKPVCDMVRGECVECLAADDCAVTKPGTVCSLGACVCAPEGATTLTYCPAGDSKPSRCVDTQTSSTDCGGCNMACFGSCSAGKCADKWRPIATAGAPSARSRHVAVSTDPKSSTAKMIVWGGNTATGLTNTGGVYDPLADTWTPTSLVNAPAPREDATAVWDDVENVMIVWGGSGTGGLLNTGGRYDPATNTWKVLSTGGAPAARVRHSAVWAKTLSTAGFMGATHGMIVWGGSDGSNPLADGWVYDPIKDAWLGPIDGQPTTLTAPTARGQHTAVWADTTNNLLVWGGFGTDGALPDVYLGDGALFEPSSTGKPTAWTTLSPSGAPSPRARHTAVWDGAAMIVWGGFSGGGSNYTSDGGRYNLAGMTWTPTGTSPAPQGREGHTAVWLDGPKQMIIFGGDQGGPPFDTAWSLDSTLAWTQLPTAPAARTRHTAVAAGSSMIVWGGDGIGGRLGDGAIYDASP